MQPRVYAKLCLSYDPSQIRALFCWLTITAFCRQSPLSEINTQTANNT